MRYVEIHFRRARHSGESPLQTPSAIVLRQRLLRLQRELCDGSGSEPGLHGLFFRWLHPMCRSLLLAS